MAGGGRAGVPPPRVFGVGGGDMPKVGDHMTVHGVLCRIFKVRAAGTVDVEALDGSGRCWRVTGLMFA